MPSACAESSGLGSHPSFYLRNSVCCFSAIYTICHPSHTHKYIFMSFIMVLAKQTSLFNSALQKHSFAGAIRQYAFTYYTRLSLESFPFPTDR